MKQPNTNQEKVFIRIRPFLLLLYILATVNTSANNLKINNVLIISQNVSLHYNLVQFNVSWENSWRVSNGPANWDAAWVFIKFRKTTGNEWHTATLNWVNGNGATDGHIAPPACTIASANDNGSGGSYGVFIYHSTDMALASVNYSNVQLRWSYGVAGVDETDSIEICVVGLEMVRVNKGSFQIGDGTTYTAGQFQDGSGGAGATGGGSPFLINSESSITLGGGLPGSLGNNNATNMFEQDDFNNVSSRILPATFPKGYDAFYCMKYEITQQQYVTFLNKLSYTQQAYNTDITTPPNSPAGTNVMTFFGTPIRNGVVIMFPGSNPNTPATYACDGNSNAIYNEIDDGHDVACNNLNWHELSAFLDWSGLRPMTELEFEKACRGDQTPVVDEYAWGSTSLGLLNNTINTGSANETPDDPNANVNCTNWTSMWGPIRVGSFGTGDYTREGTGATYYGIMEMSGNMWERTVSVGSPAGRNFTGLHGNGELTSTGDADVPNWPDMVTAAGIGFRGGAWYCDEPAQACVSQRFYATSAQTISLYNFGGRGVRTAPY